MGWNTQLIEVVNPYAYRRVRDGVASNPDGMIRARVCHPRTRWPKLEQKRCRFVMGARPDLVCNKGGQREQGSKHGPTATWHGGLAHCSQVNR